MNNKTFIEIRTVNEGRDEFTFITFVTPADEDGFPDTRFTLERNDLIRIIELSKDVNLER